MVTVSRRTLLKIGGVLGLSGSIPSLASGGRRPFTFEDVARRWDVERTAISTRGVVAVQVTRPAAAGGWFAESRGPAIQPRGEIWILEDALQQLRRLSLGDLWAWAPTFSPLGSRLAVLTSDGRGAINITVWDTEAWKPRTFSELAADPYVKFGSAGPNEVTGQWVPSWQQLLWLDEQALLFVDSGPLPVQFDNAIAAAERTYDPLWERAARGQPSVRLWRDDSPTCGAQRSLRKLNCLTGESRTLLDADIRGVSLSPDCRRLAVLTASGRPLPSAGAMEPPLRLTSGGDDPLVNLELSVFDLQGSNEAAKIEGFECTGNVAPRRLPYWSRTGQRFAIPARVSYSGAESSADDACWEVELTSMRATRRPSSSALDAELQAAIVAMSDGEGTERRLASRPRYEHDDREPPPGGLIPGAVWTYGDSFVAFWAPPSLTLIGVDGSASIPFQFPSVNPPVAAGRESLMLARSDDGRGLLLRLRGLSFAAHHLDIGKEVGYLGINPQSGGVICCEDTDDDTSVFEVVGRNRNRTPLIFNQHFADVIRPARRLVVRDAAETTQSTGVLMLPADHVPGDRHPVILWAYPNMVPALDGLLSWTNKISAYIYPIQYLLSRGFAVFHAPLPVRGLSWREPITRIGEAILPWLDVLDRQPEVLPGEYAVYGHSNAGFVALVLETLTTRFKAIVAACTFPDYIATLASWGANQALECASGLLQADRWYTEHRAQPFGFRVPPWKDESLWGRNSPLLRLESARTPLLLIEGEFDVMPRSMEEVYSVLHGRGVPVEMAYYWGEGHVIASPGNVRDCWERIETFLGSHLSRRPRR